MDFRFCITDTIYFIWYSSGVQIHILNKLAIKVATCFKNQLLLFQVPGHYVFFCIVPDVRVLCVVVLINQNCEFVCMIFEHFN
jgi:hypothetical protein